MPSKNRPDAAVASSEAKHILGVGASDEMQITFLWQVFLYEIPAGVEPMQVSWLRSNAPFDHQLLLVYVETSCAQLPV